MDQDLKILQMPQKDLVSTWETCIQNGMRAKIAVEDELAKGMRANVRESLNFLCFSFGLKDYLADRSCQEDLRL